MWNREGKAVWMFSIFFSNVWQEIARIFMVYVRIDPQRLWWMPQVGIQSPAPSHWIQFRHLCWNNFCAFHFLLTPSWIASTTTTSNKHRIHISQWLVFAVPLILSRWCGGHLRGSRHQGWAPGFEVKVIGPDRIRMAPADPTRGLSGFTLGATLRHRDLQVGDQRISEIHGMASQNLPWLNFNMRRVGALIGFSAVAIVIAVCQTKSWRQKDTIGT
jgi:hypothetical protein